MSITKYLNLSHLRKLLSALGQRFYAIEQRQDNLQSQIENIDLDVETDTTLSVSGMPADAQAVGSEFGNLSDTAYSGNISSLANITSLDQDVLYSSMGYFGGSSAISNLYIPTKTGLNLKFPVFVSHGLSFSAGVSSLIYTKRQPTTSLGFFNYLFVDGQSANHVDSGLYIGYIISIDQRTQRLCLDTVFTVNKAAYTTSEKPLMDGTAFVGSSIKYARADHVHPSDTTKADAYDVLTKTNTIAYTPTATYHPATKGYVDGLIPANVSDLNNDSGFQTQAQVENAIAQSAEVIVVNLTSTTTDGVTTYTADKTFAELKAAHNAGKILILLYGDTVYHICYVTSTILNFYFITPITFVLNVFAIKSDNTVKRFDSVSAVRSVNNKKGVVTLTYSDVGALPDSTVIPTKVSDLNNDAGYQTQAQVESTIAQNTEIVVVNVTSTTTGGVTTYTADKTYSDLYNAYDAGKTLVLHYGYFVYYLAAFGASRFRFVCVNPISSVPSAFTITSNDVTTYREFKNVLTVNGQDGTVTLTYSDVGALPDTTVIPTKVSDLNNDAGYQTQAQVNALIAAAGDDDTTYAISMSGNVITLTGSDGNTSTVMLPVYTGGVV